MGGGTPANKGTLNLDENESDAKRLEKMKQEQELPRRTRQNNTNQSPDHDTI
jgi:hypothetical protein